MKNETWLLAAIGLVAFYFLFLRKAVAPAIASTIPTGAGATPYTGGGVPIAAGTYTAPTTSSNSTGSTLAGIGSLLGGAGSAAGSIWVRSATRVCSAAAAIAAATATTGTTSSHGRQARGVAVDCDGRRAAPRGLLVPAASSCCGGDGVDGARVAHRQHASGTARRRAADGDGAGQSEPERGRGGFVGRERLKPGAVAIALGGPGFSPPVNGVIRKLPIRGVPIYPRPDAGAVL